MTLFEHYQEKTKKALNQDSASESEVINFLKNQNKPGSPKPKPYVVPENPQEGDEIEHDNGKNYRFTNGSWLPFEK